MYNCLEQVCIYILIYTYIQTYIGRDTCVFLFYTFDKTLTCLCVSVSVFSLSLFLAPFVPFSLSPPYPFLAPAGNHTKIYFVEKIPNMFSSSMLPEEEKTGKK